MHLNNERENSYCYDPGVRVVRMAQADGRQDVQCSECGEWMGWGIEYYPDDVDGMPEDQALCPDCYHG